MFQIWQIYNHLWVKCVSEISKRSIEIYKRYNKMYKPKIEFSNHRNWLLSWPTDLKVYIVVIYYPVCMYQPSLRDIQ